MTARLGAFQIKIRVPTEAPLLILGAGSRRTQIPAGRFPAFVSRRTGASALMVHVARLATGGLLRTGGVAVVHQIDHFSVGERDGLAAADAQLIILVFSEDGESASLGEGSRSVLHDAAVVVRDADVVGALLLVEVVKFGGGRVLVDDDEALVTILARLLVMKADDVTQLVQDRLLEHATVPGQREQHVFARVTHGGKTAAQI